ncbi:MAG: LysM peptidoglycan-binding domain-containing protein [Solirubrobacterales bacterium]|jgi:LysM repeat protein|nr:LysM peptidoglycan-binding domain-containing protein [Solirubrobacterales bacterium]
MTRITPARLLAPLALVTVAVALYLVVNGGTSDPGNRVAPSAVKTRSSKTEGDPSPKSKRSTGRRRYTVRPGDTPSGIAEKTGVSVTKLLELNPDLSPQALSPGDRLKLR